jgi:hypothetical protein
MANRPPRGSCEYFKDFYNNDIYGDKQITGRGIQQIYDPPIITSVDEQITISGFKYIADKLRIKGHKIPKNVEECLPEKRCIYVWTFDNESKGIGNVAFFDYLNNVTPTIIFKSYEEICSKICKTVHSITTERDADTKNYSIVYSMIAKNNKLNRDDPYNIGTEVFTIDEYTKFVNKNKNKKPTEMPMMLLFVNMDNFVETELSYTEWFKTQPNALPKTDPLPTVELPKTDTLQTTVESPKTDTLPTVDDDDDDPPPAYDKYNNYDKDPPPGYYDQNYTTVPTGQPSSTGPTSEDDKDPPHETGGARSRRCRKDRKNKSRRCRKSKRRNNKKRRRNTRR